MFYLMHFIPLNPVSVVTGHWRYVCGQPGKQKLSGYLSPLAVPSSFDNSYISTVGVKIISDPPMYLDDGTYTTLLLYSSINVAHSSVLNKCSVNIY